MSELTWSNASRSCQETPRVWSAQFQVVATLMIVGPVAWAVVVPMKVDLQVSSERGTVRVIRRLLDGLAGKGNDYLLLAPADPLDPFRRDEDFLARQPVAVSY